MEITALGVSFDIVLTLDFLVANHGTYSTLILFLVEFVDNGIFKRFENIQIYN
jgi:hypothetical protein